MKFGILKYKLKIKDMKNEEILNKTISTNDKVVLDYTDARSDEYQVVLSSSPKIKLTQVEEIEEKEDNTTAKGTLPKTGTTYFIIAFLGIIVIAIIFTFVKVKSYKDIG